LNAFIDGSYRLMILEFITDRSLFNCKIDKILDEAVESGNLNIVKYCCSNSVALRYTIMSTLETAASGGHGEILQ
jgi:hypothetical protein